MFKTEEKSTFKYWFAHWCAFQMTALNLRIWKFKYLFHDIWKPWQFLLLYGGDPDEYPKVRNWHRSHNNHHVEWLKSVNHHVEDFDIDEFIIDVECSHYTKEDSPIAARERITNKYKDAKKKCWSLTEFDLDLYNELYIYHKALARLAEIEQGSKN